jgi:hypothetical protein
MGDSLTDVYDTLVAETSTDDSTVSSVDTPEAGITESESLSDIEEFSSDNPETEPELEPEVSGENDADVFDWEAYADQLIPVKVNGEELLVPLREARDGVMLRKDYSQKTEELAKDRKLVDWAKDVQYAFETDPAGTLKAFAQAYGLESGSSQQPLHEAVVPESDPYEDWDPDIAQVARAFDQKLAQVTEHYEQKIARIESQTGQITHERMVQQAQAEMQTLRSQFDAAGLEFDELGVLQVATENEIPLTQAAMLWAGSNAIKGGKTQSEANAAAVQAGKVAAQASESDRQQAKKRVSTAATKKYDAGPEALDTSEFSTLTDLFNLELARQ